MKQKIVSEEHPQPKIPDEVLENMRRCRRYTPAKKRTKTKIQNEIRNGIEEFHDDLTYQGDFTEYDFDI